MSAYATELPVLEALVVMLPFLGAPTGYQLVKNFKENWASIGGAAAASIGAFIVAIGVGLANIVTALAGIFINPAEALSGGSADLISAFLGSMALILRAAAETTITTIAPGATWAIGPFTWLYGILLTGLGLWGMAQILQSEATSDLLPGTFSDVPLLGANEDE